MSTINRWFQAAWAGTWATGATNGAVMIDRLRRTGGTMDMLEDWGPDRGCKVTVPGYYRCTINVRFTPPAGGAGEDVSSLSTGINVSGSNYAGYGMMAVRGKSARSHLYSATRYIHVVERQVLVPWLDTYDESKTVSYIDFFVELATPRNE